MESVWHVEVIAGEVVHAPGAVRVSSRRFLKIGRAPTTDIRVAQSEVSNFHASLTLSPQRVVVRDLASDTGTWVNGVRIDRTELAPGDTVQVGHTVFRIHALDPTQTSEAASNPRPSIARRPTPTHAATAPSNQAPGKSLRPTVSGLRQAPAAPPFDFRNSATAHEAAPSPRKSPFEELTDPLNEISAPANANPTAATEATHELGPEGHETLKLKRQLGWSRRRNHLWVVSVTATIAAGLLIAMVWFDGRPRPGDATAAASIRSQGQP